MDLEQSIKRMYDYFTEINKSVSLIQWHYKDKFRQSTETNKVCEQGNNAKPVENSQAQIIDLVPEKADVIQDMKPPQIIEETQVNNQTQVIEQPPISNQAPAINQNQVGNGTNGTREFTLEELQQYNGTNGNPAYVAVDGIVYDVSNEARWAGGRHFGVKAGTDGTTNYMQCHGKSGAVNKLKKVGVVKK